MILTNAHREERAERIPDEAGTTEVLRRSRLPLMVKCRNFKEGATGRRESCLPYSYTPVKEGRSGSRILNLEGTTHLLCWAGRSFSQNMSNNALRGSRYQTRQVRPRCGVGCTFLISLEYRYSARKVRLSCKNRTFSIYPRL
jgi:hypothetical protein